MARIFNDITETIDNTVWTDQHGFGGSFIEEHLQIQPAVMCREAASGAIQLRQSGKTPANLQSSAPSRNSGAAESDCVCPPIQ